MNFRYDVIKEAIEPGFLEIPDIPNYISKNLKHTLFDWQKKAIEYFLIEMKSSQRRQKVIPTHLMFNMATGSGKTLIMAAAILYYFKHGYRHFLFFVNQNNIVDKTENNFVEKSHSKYLFAEKIVIQNQTIDIRKVDTFSEDPQGIEIKFTSIQKLYNLIHIERENETTLSDLHRKNIVMLADEAHHLNTNTKKKGMIRELAPRKITNRSGKEEVERKGWEHTVIQLILHKNGREIENRNVLLEFTATVPAIQSIAEKYKDKIIYKFGLKDFLQAGYTKGINLISSTLDKKERILLALLFQWYRHKIALEYGLSNFKPVVLFRSKTIAGSRDDHKMFLDLIDGLSYRDFDFLKQISEKISKSPERIVSELGRSRTEQILTFIERENIVFSEIVEWIRQNFQEKNIIITNSKDNTTKIEKTDEETNSLLNSLEDTNNHIRAIFTVNRLTEGWDVLNLFDIVRLYEGQNAGGSSKKTPEATIKEKQLIGRGVRYFPFSFENELRNKRKFDDDLNHKLRVLEELCYYTYDEESRYISHLKNELRKDGYISDDKIVHTFSMKESFVRSAFYNNSKIWYNEQLSNPNRRRKSLDDIAQDFFVPYKIIGLELSEQVVDFENQKDLEELSLHDDFKTITKKLGEMERHIFLKAVNIKAKEMNSLFRFENLREELEITSISELYTDKLAEFDISFIVHKTVEYEDISNEDKLATIIKFLEAIFEELESKIIPKIGSGFVLGEFKSLFEESKTKTVSKKSESENLTKELKKREWYVLDSFYGTSEEQAFIEFFKDSLGELQNRYDEVYLVRNEEVYKIYDFEKGRGFQPDFLLFLKGKEKPDDGDLKNSTSYYQIFIEPKGGQFLGTNNTFEAGKEGWKEKFLQDISAIYSSGEIIRAENANYKLIGLPFFNSDYELNKSFRQKYRKLTDVEGVI